VNGQRSSHPSLTLHRSFLISYSSTALLPPPYVVPCNTSVFSIAMSRSTTPSTLSPGAPPILAPAFVSSIPPTLFTAVHRASLMKADLLSSFHQHVDSLDSSFQRFAEQIIASHRKVAALSLSSALLPSRGPNSAHWPLLYYCVQFQAVDASSDGSAVSPSLDVLQAQFIAVFLRLLRLYAARAQQVASRPKVKAVRSLTATTAPSTTPGPSTEPRRPFPTSATAALKRWFIAHLSSPYPSQKQKSRLCRATGMTVEQLGNWSVPAHPPTQSPHLRLPHRLPNSR
jgi:hypothetical protein